MTDTGSYVLRARRVLTSPDAPIIEDGAIIVCGGLVADTGPWRELKARAPADVRDMGAATLVPAPVNAHCHLELSHLGLPPVLGAGFLEWVRWLIAQPVGEFSPDAVRAAVSQMEAVGTAAVADIATRKGAEVAAVLKTAPLDYVIQHEVFGYSYDDSSITPSPGGSLAGHALYSTAPEALRRAKAWDSAHGKAFSLHLAEHEGEVELLAQGSGAFADFMRQRILPPTFAAPGLSPVAWAAELGLLDQSTLAVHAVHLSGQDIIRLAASRATVCLCPRSNAVIGVGRASVRALLDAGVPCCLGTDSLASAPDLDIWAELAALLEFCPITLRESVGLLATNAARVLGFARLGALTPGKAARAAVLPSALERALRD
ncbi:amidohydrolase family protein [Fundidesulfovibrio agrisoli]|uniref:amidohydrolase family protein n=1 Tax=Fundidesulfovibrio agrisoli TaxID=2922717 RepID=UPI001FABBBB8|nr:amidohydrolase family protein [Fundidesulfovibrio agrisoli]